LFSLFRKSPSTASPPQISLLQPLLDFPVDTINVPPQQFLKALKGLNTYATHLKSHFLARSQGGNSEDDLVLSDEDITHLTRLYQAYLKAVKITGVVIQDEQTPFIHGDPVRDSMPILLRGIFHLYTQLALIEDPIARSAADAATNFMPQYLLEPLLSDITNTHHCVSAPTPSSDSPFLSLFTRSKQIITSLQAANRPIAKSKVNAKSVISPASMDVTDEDAQEMMLLLEAFAAGCDGIASLPGPKLAKTKAQKEEEKRRPMRVAIEARMLRCDIAMNMANRDIKAIKARALKRQHAKVVEIESDDESEGEKEEEDRKPEIDVKPTILETEAVMKVEAQVEDNKPEGEKVKWEDIVAAALMECLESTRKLLQEKRASVLTSFLDREEWLGSEDTSSMRHKSLSPLVDGNDESDDDSDESSDSEEEVETYPCPLRSLLRLHDRYEEQRLAVWLSLPVSTRGSMGAYMRGLDIDEENNEENVGRKWDEVGLLLLLDHDR
jgi:hypothetical protein